MLDAAQNAVQFISRKKRRNLDTDKKLNLALVRLLEIIGEAAGGVSSELRNKYPEIAWRQMAGMRNRLIHSYFEINNDVVWETITQELPRLIVQLQQMLQNEL